MGGYPGLQKTNTGQNGFHTFAGHEQNSCRPWSRKKLVRMQGTIFSPSGLHDLIWRIFRNVFPDSSVAKECACNAGDPGLIPGSGRSSGEGIGYPLQHSWASIVAQLIKNLPTMWETWVRFLHWKDPLEKGKATHSIILAQRIPWTAQSMQLQRVGHD